MSHPASIFQDPMVTALDDLVSRGPLSVAFQPIVDLASGDPLGYEVLGRCAPVLGLLAPVVAKGPAAMLDVAHRHRRLLSLDRRWRELAMAAIASFADQSTTFFINVDPRVGDDPLFSPGNTLALAKRYNLSPSRFVLELTESACADMATIERTLADYAHCGFRVALDDLGAGQQSLGNVLRLKPDVVKLDKQLLRGSDTDPTRAMLLAAMAEFCRKAGMLLVAEGVETAESLKLVVEAGVPCAQGFFLGRPASLPAGLTPEVQRLLRTLSKRGTRDPVAPIAAVSGPDPTAPLLRLVEGLRRGPLAVEVMLHHVTDCVAELLDAERVSLRLVDEGRTRLLVAARTGAPLHADGAAEWTLGEGLAGWVARERSALRVDDAEADPRFVRRPGMEGQMGSFLGVPILDSDGCIGVLATTSRWRGAFSDTHEKWLRLVAGIAGPYLDMARLQRLALTDALTCVWNRHALDNVLGETLGTDEEPASVLLIDVDHFKRINDAFGHPVGDEVLRAVTHLIRESLRRGDHILRMGGEEFLVVLPGVRLPAATAIAERMRRSASEREIVPGVSLTLSIGVVARRHGEDRSPLLTRLDAALYKAKREGRDRIAVEDSLAEL